jgi:serine/threonine protein kinase
MLGELAENAGQQSEARAHYEAILALDFHYPLARERALRLAEEQGQPNSSYVQHTITQGVQGGALGRFVLQRELGRGGAGAVYLATDNQLQRHVALKILHPHLAAKESERQRFMSEAYAASCLHHPGVIRVYDIDESIFAIAMEHLSGGTLKERLSGGVSPREALAFCREVAATLAFIHERGFIHRDLKPANLLFRAAGSEGSAGRLVLTDFGVAHIGGDTDKGVVGTLAYMAPEQWKGVEVTPKSDLYALGVILYESLAGKLPYTPEELTRGTARFPIQAATERLPQGLRPRVAALLQALLAPDPKDRPEGAKQVEAELRRLTEIFALGEDGAAVFLDAISVAKTQTSLRPETRRVLLRAANALGLSQEETVSIAVKNGLSSQETSLLATEMGSETS